MLFQVLAPAITLFRLANPRSRVKWGRLVRSVDTVVILMGLHKLREIMNQLLESDCEPDRPVALIQSGTRSSQRTVSGTVATIAELAHENNIRSPVVIVIGEVARLSEELKWFGQNSLRPRTDPEITETAKWAFENLGLSSSQHDRRTKIRQLTHKFRSQS